MEYDSGYAAIQIEEGKTVRVPCYCDRGTVHQIRAVLAQIVEPRTETARPKPCAMGYDKVWRENDGCRKLCPEDRARWCIGVKGKPVSDVRQLAIELGVL